MVRLGGLVCLPFRFIGSRGPRVLTSVVPATTNRSLSFIAAETMKPPVAKKVKHEMTLFDDVRIDNYYWLRDDSRTNPEVLSHISQENSYTDSVMSGTKKFEDEIYSEIRGRIKEDDVTAPKRKGQYYYYKRTLEGKEYAQHCRRLVPNNGAPPSVFDVMRDGPDAPPEHVILDENIKAQGHDYYSIGSQRTSKY
ncbi:hypothetical protein QJS10_CPB11g02366 [Acorus calamus]|uniref:Peptidase S9A N-terminal domain-containing protein n=1 Tax=Acorus calamus TaxID=4465 RepID=A0AAV9DTB4_ACOCL|nr:hypothetical protein QJS10_CPB11g02366 [Acorus calamus]